MSALFSAALLSGCSFYAQNRLDLTILANEKPAQDYEVELWFPKSYGADRMNPNFNSREILPLGTFYTDKNGNLQFPLNLITDVRPRKPMFFISSADITQCQLMLWYMEKEKFFIPMKYKNGEISGIKYLDDVTGDFQKTKNGWNVTATIHRMDRICQE